MSRWLIILSSFLLASCVSRPQYSPMAFPHKYCPGFVKPTWNAVVSPGDNQQLLIDKQKFAVLPEQYTIWFSAKDKYLGLCIPPLKKTRRLSNDCGTAYVTYVKRRQEWHLLEQKVTICPGS